MLDAGYIDAIVLLHRRIIQRIASRKHNTYRGELVITINVRWHCLIRPLLSNYVFYIDNRLPMRPINTSISNEADEHEMSYERKPYIDQINKMAPVLLP